MNSLLSFIADDDIDPACRRRYGWISGKALVREQAADNRMLISACVAFAEDFGAHFKPQLEFLHTLVPPLTKAQRASVNQIWNRITKTPFTLGDYERKQRRGLR